MTDRRQHTDQITDLPADTPTVEQAEGVRGGEAIVGEPGAVATSDAVVSPRDPASGLPTGKRMHKPLTIA